MTDNKPNPAADPAKQPQNQADEDHGSITSKQVTEDTMRRRTDTPRGSEPETRASASRRG